MNKKNILKIICSILAVSFGAFMFVYGEMDDSPGGQVLGLIAVIVGIIIIVKRKKNST